MVVLLLVKRLCDVNPATDGGVVVWVSEAPLVNSVLLEVRAGLGGLKAEAVEEIDVGLCAVALVVFVADSGDFVEAAVEAELGLGLEDGLHGCE